MHRKIEGNLNAYFIIVLFIWISLLPAPMQNQYSMTLKIFLFLAFLDLWARKGNGIFRKDSLSLWIFILGISLSNFFAVNKEAAFTAYLNMALPLVFIYYMAREDFSDGFAFSILVKAISLCSIIVALIGLAQCIVPNSALYKYFGESPFFKAYLNSSVRPVSTQWHPKVLASYLVYSLPFNILLFKTGSLLFRRLAVAGIVLSVAAAVLTFSRSAFLSIVTMVLFYLFMQKNFVLIRVFLVSLLLFGFVSSVFPWPLNRFSIDCMVVNPYTSMLSINNFMKHFRVIEMIKTSPLTGAGFGNSNWVIDNTYLKILVEAGIIGFLGFAIFIMYLLQCAWKKLGRLEAGSKEWWFLFVVLMSFIGLLVDISGYDVIFWPNPYLYFCILAGCMAALSRPEQVKNNEPNA